MTIWLVDAFAEAVKSQVFGGVVAGSLVVSLVYSLKALPGQLYNLLKWRFTCSLTVFSEDAAFEKVNEWLSGLDYAASCRQARLQSASSGPEGSTDLILSPGLGKHLIWYKLRPVLVQRFLPDKGGIGGWKRFEDICIYTLGSSPTLLRDLVTEISEARRDAAKKNVDVFLYRHRWRLVCRKPRRDIESVEMPAAQRERIVSDFAHFLKAREWYASRGVPYRRGYLFEGPPGCGKTSLAIALASHFGRPIYALNLGSVGNDDELIDAICEVPEHGVLLLEDVDAAKTGASRVTVASGEPAAIGSAPKEQPREVSLSALLNAIDGVYSRDGRILIMTTNHPEKIDPALIRPGRADRREVIGLLSGAEIERMCRRFVNNELDARRFAKTVEGPIAAAELQEMLLRRAG